CDVDELAVADDRIEERAARLTMGVIAVLVAIEQKAVPTLGDAQLVALDAAERFEGRTSGSPAVRAMTIHGVEEFIGHGVVDRATKALAHKGAVACLLMARHRASPQNGRRTLPSTAHRVQRRSAARDPFRTSGSTHEIDVRARPDFPEGPIVGGPDCESIE